MQNKTRRPMPPLGFSLAAEVPARAIRLEKEIKGILIGRAKIKTFACRGLNISGKKKWRKYILVVVPDSGTEVFCNFPGDSGARSIFVLILIFALTNTTCYVTGKTVLFLLSTLFSQVLKKKKSAIAPYSEDQTRSIALTGLFRFSRLSASCYLKDCHLP